MENYKKTAHGARHNIVNLRRIFTTEVTEYHGVLNKITLFLRETPWLYSS